jgi:F0F1-type ATP synthase membrane subunit b/b'
MSAVMEPPPSVAGQAGNANGNGATAPAAPAVNTRLPFDPFERGEAVKKQTVCLEISLHGVGFRRKMRSADIVTDDTDLNFVHVSKDLIDQKELRAIRRLDNDLKTWLSARAVPSSIIRGGNYLIPAKLVEAVDARINEFMDERKALVEEFLAKYDELKANARERLKTHYNEAEYPPAEEVRGAFFVEARFVAENVPEKLKEISRSMYEREREKAEVKWSVAADEIKDAMRQSFAELVARMADRLGTDPETGKPRVFRDTMVEQMSEFLNLFESRNLANDEELSALTKQARDLLRGVTPKDLRTQGELREQLRQSFEKIDGQMAGMVTTKARRFSLDKDV